MRDEIKWMGRKEAFPLPYYRLTAHIWLPSRCQRGVSRCGIPENLHFCGGKSRVSAKKIILQEFFKAEKVCFRHQQQEHPNAGIIQAFALRHHTHQHSRTR